MIYKLAILLAFTAGFFLLAKTSQAAETKKGLINGKLRLCPNSPNCVSSESAMIPPIILTDTELKPAWEQLQKIIVKQGGEIQSQTDNYLAAKYTSAIFRFVDDVEARLDEENNIIHLRSGSRVGYYDFGANRRRVEKIINAMHLFLHP